MVKIKELTIGCKVLFLGEEMEINSIEKQTVNNTIPINNLQGIEITESLLQELGFRLEIDRIIPNYKSYKKDINGFHITVTNLSNTPGRNWSIHIDSSDFSTSGGTGDIQYLHQLQSFINLITE